MKRIKFKYVMIALIIFAMVMFTIGALVGETMTLVELFCAVADGFMLNYWINRKE